MNQVSKNEISRRSLLKFTGACGLTFLATGCGLTNRLAGVPQTQLPTIEDAWTYEKGKLTLDMKKLPEITKLGGAVRIEGGALPDPILVVYGEDKNYYAFKNACTHAGRMIDPLAGTMNLQCCSVGRSTYDYRGKVLSGPAKKALTSYPLSVDGDNIIIIVLS